MNRPLTFLVFALCLGASALAQTPRESLARAEALFAQGHGFTAEEFTALTELQATLEGEGEADLAADLALLRRAASTWVLTQGPTGPMAPFSDQAWEWELRDKRQRERDFWLGVRNLGLTAFVLSSTSTLVLAWTLDRNDALMSHGGGEDYRQRDAAMDRLNWALGASVATTFLSLFPLLWGEARQ